MTDKSIGVKDLEEVFAKVDFEKLIRDQIIEEIKEEFRKQYDRYLMTILYGRSIIDDTLWENLNDRN